MYVVLQDILKVLIQKPLLVRFLHESQISLSITSAGFKMVEIP